MTDERQERLRLLENLRQDNKAYSYNFDRSHRIRELQKIENGN
ncbi:MAG: hypothetical protein J07AB43_09980, partial [Candidatus Nanosalina sp. J07AB43]